MNRAKKKIIIFPHTNADKIRIMTDEELADWIHERDCNTILYGYHSKSAILEWLKEEIQE